METVGIPKEIFDRMLGSLYGLPDVASTKAATVNAATPMIGTLQTFFVQTYRQRETKEVAGKEQARSRDTIFIQCVTAEGTIRIALPPDVADCIARQRDSLTAKSRSRAAKTVAQARKDRGELPGFMKHREAGA